MTDEKLHHLQLLPYDELASLKHLTQQTLGLRIFPPQFESLPPPPSSFTKAKFCHMISLTTLRNAGDISKAKTSKSSAHEIPVSITRQSVIVHNCTLGHFFSKK